MTEKKASKRRLVAAVDTKGKTDDEVAAEAMAAFYKAHPELKPAGPKK